MLLGRTQHGRRRRGKGLSEGPVAGQAGRQEPSHLWPRGRPRGIYEGHLIQVLVASDAWIFSTSPPAKCHLASAYVPLVTETLLMLRHCFQN